MVVSLIECGSIFRALEFGFLVNVLKAEDFVCVCMCMCVVMFSLSFYTDRPALIADG